MFELYVLPDADQSRVRLEAARIGSFRRRITRSNALRDLDRQIIREGVAAGLGRGAAFQRADVFIDAVKQRITEIERLQGECIITRNVIPLRQRGAAA